MSGPTYIKRELLKPHPENPRVCLREDVVNAISAALTEAGEFPPEHSLIARKLGTDYQVLAGHHRLAGAEKAGIEKVPVWVKELDDQAAFMLLATSNNQGELSPLEIGIHAFRAVPPSQGKRGEGLQEYADRLGKSRPYVSQIRSAAEVVLSTNFVSQLTKFTDKSQHLAAIHKLPRGCWQEACEWLATHEASVADVEKRVEQALEFRKEFYG